MGCGVPNPPLIPSPVPDEIVNVMYGEKSTVAKFDHGASAVDALVSVAAENTGPPLPASDVDMSPCTTRCSDYTIVRFIFTCGTASIARLHTSGSENVVSIEPE
jgi:hypothetical protein